MYADYLGERYVPVDKRQDFIRDLMKILNYGGMTILEKVCLYGKEICLLKPFEIHEMETVAFHYNYFEDNSWDWAKFDTKNIELYSKEIGTSEFSYVMVAAYTLYEYYDSKLGVAEINDQILFSRRSVGWLNHLLDKQYTMERRFDLWDAYELYCSSYKSREIKLDDILSFISCENIAFCGGVEFTDVCYVIYGTETLQKEEIEPNSYPEIVYKCKCLLKDFFQSGEFSENQKREQIWDLVRKSRLESLTIKSQD